MNPRAARLRPTTGAGVVLAVVLGAVPAGVLGLELAWLVVALGCAALLLSAWAAARAVRAFELVEAPATARAVVGRTSTLPVELRVTARTPPVTLTALEERASRSATDAASRVELAGLHAGARLRTRVLARFGRRGTLPRIALEVATSFPFGLVEARAQLSVACEVAVGPRPAGARVPELARWAVGRGTVLAAELVPRTDGFVRDLPDGLREARGDETAREIAWRASARAGRTIALERRAAPRPTRVDVVLVTSVLGPERGPRRRDDEAFEATVAFAQALVHALAQRDVRARLALSGAAPDASATAHAAAAGTYATTRSTIRRVLVGVARTGHGAERASSEPPRGGARGDAAAATIVLLPTAPLALTRGSSEEARPPGPRDALALVQIASPTRQRIVSGASATRPRHEGREEPPAREVAL
ncbi:MAG: DUF58 domain-containing protein [Planctomycetota bacterium]